MFRLQPNQHIPVLYHPDAGKNTRRAGLGPKVGYILSGGNLLFPASTPQELQANVDALFESNAVVAALLGGDGTIKLTISCIINTYERHGALDRIPKLILLAGGTVNVTVSTLGTHSYLQSESAIRLSQLIRFKSEGIESATCKTVQIRPLWVNGIYGFLFASGLPVAFMDEYYREGKRRGILGMLRTGWKRLSLELLRLLRLFKDASSTPIHMPAIITDGTGRVMDRTVHETILVSALQKFAFGFKAFPGVDQTNGDFMLRSSNQSLWGVLGSFPRIFFGTSVRKTIDWVTRAVTIDFGQMTKWQLDGDYHESDRVHIKYGPELTLIVG